MSDPSVPWIVAAYAVAFVLLGGYSLRLALAKRRAGGRTGRTPTARLGPWTPRHRSRAASRAARKWVAGISLIVAAIVGLAAWAILSPGALAYYKTPSEIVAGGRASFGRHPARRRPRRRRHARAQRDDRPLHDHATARAPSRSTYRGEVPDTLKEGTDAIAEGTLDRRRDDARHRVQAKCSSKFVPKDRPGDLGKT